MLNTQLLQTNPTTNMKQELSPGALIKQWGEFLKERELLTNNQNKSKAYTMQHIKEPWISNTTSIGTFIIHEGLIIAKMRELEGIEHRANADRIVACVNAMAGIEDPAQMREMWDIVKHLELDAYPVLKEKTDTLLAALQFCKSVIESGGMHDRSEQLAVEEATRAINLIVS